MKGPLRMNSRTGSALWVSAAVIAVAMTLLLNWSSPDVMAIGRHVLLAWAASALFMVGGLIAQPALLHGGAGVVAGLCVATANGEGAGLLLVLSVPLFLVYGLYVARRVWGKRSRPSDLVRRRIVHGD